MHTIAKAVQHAHQVVKYWPTSFCPSNFKSSLWCEKSWARITLQESVNKCQGRQTNNCTITTRLTRPACSITYTTASKHQAYANETWSHERLRQGKVPRWLTVLRLVRQQARHVIEAYDKHACKMSLFHAHVLTASVHRIRTVTKKRLTTAACSLPNLFGADNAGEIPLYPRCLNRSLEDTILPGLLVIDLLSDPFWTL